ncbi:hypothetical protein V5799_011852 [Amblyomma americanum]|uniref:Uncharacterized protein n=1 Tax=Amblyomma americanum TaxID=6943 RepID=A0AAQ4EGI7_AMBAM
MAIGAARVTTLTIKKRLVAASKKTGCGDCHWVQPVVNHLYWCVAVSAGDGKLLVAIWKSMLNHVANVQSVHGDPYPRSLHDSTPNGKWLSPGTPAYARLVALASERLLLKDIEKLSASIQTYNLESFHGVLIKFAPKSVSFSTDIVRASHPPSH